MGSINNTVLTGLYFVLPIKMTSIIFSGKPNCDKCDEFETHIESLQDDFKNHMNAVSVKSINSHLSRLYNPAKDPALVFFRHGVPLLFSGETSFFGV